MTREQYLKIKIDMLEKGLKNVDKTNSLSIRNHSDLIKRLMDGEKVSDYEMIMQLNSVKCDDFLDEEHEQIHNDWVEAERKYSEAKEVIKNNATDNIYVDNSRYMELIDDIATQMTEMAHIDTDGSCIAYNEIRDGLSDDTCIIFTEEAQDFYNERYDEIEAMIQKTIKVYSNNELLKVGCDDKS